MIDLGDVMVLSLECKRGDDCTECEVDDVLKPEVVDT